MSANQDLGYWRQFQLDAPRNLGIQGMEAVTDSAQAALPPKFSKQPDQQAAGAQK